MKEWRYQLKQSWWKSFFRQPENQKKDWFIRADNKGIHFLAELLPENDLVQQSVAWHELTDLYVVENWAIVLQLDEVPNKKGCFYEYAVSTQDLLANQVELERDLLTLWQQHIDIRVLREKYSDVGIGKGFMQGEAR